MKRDWNLTTAHFYLTVLVILTYPFSIQACSIAFGIWVFNWILMAIAGLLHKPSWPWLILMVSLPLAFVLSLIYTENISEGLHAVERRASLILAPLVLSTAPAWDKSTLNRFFFFAYLAALGAAITCLVVAAFTYFSTGINHFYWKPLTEPIRFHPGYFSFFIGILVFWQLRDLTTMWKNRSILYRTFALASMIFLSLFMILLASRVQLALFYVTLVVLFLYYSKDFRPMIRLSLIFFFILCVFLIGNTYIRERINSIKSFSYNLNDPPQQFNELTIRMALAECAWKVIRQNPVIGVGAGDSYAELEKIYRQYDYQFGYLEHQEPHDEYLNTLVNTGFVGFLLLILNLGFSFREAWRQRDLVHFLFILFFAIGCLFESMLSQQKGIVLFALFNSLFVFSGVGKEQVAGEVRTNDI